MWEIKSKGINWPNFEENSASGQPLLQLVIKDGKQLKPLEDLSTIRERTRLSVVSLPAETRLIDQPTSIPVEISAALQQLTQETKKCIFRKTS